MPGSVPLVYGEAGTDGSMMISACNMYTVVTPAKEPRASNTYLLAGARLLLHSLPARLRLQLLVGQGGLGGGAATKAGVGVGVVVRHAGAVVLVVRVAAALVLGGSEACGWKRRQMTVM